MTNIKKRKKVVEKYYELKKLGQIYSQDLTKREYVFKKYKDGKYYSDCSSSVRNAYKEANVGFNNIGSNTADIYNLNKSKEVKVTIKNGQIENASTCLRIGDILLYRGGDKTRPRKIGHVEIVSKIENGVVYCIGHGSDPIKEKVLNEYNSLRYNIQVKDGKDFWNRGIECVIRLIKDVASFKTKVCIKGKNKLCVYKDSKLTTPIGSVKVDSLLTTYKMGKTSSKILYKDEYAYVRTKWITKNTENPKSAIVDIKGKDILAIFKDLKMKKIIYTVRNGQKVDILKYANPYSKIKYDNKVGYVRTKWLKY